MLGLRVDFKSPLILFGFTPFNLSSALEAYLKRKNFLTIQLKPSL